MGFPRVWVLMLLTACTGDPLALRLEGHDSHEGDEESIIEGIEDLQMADVDNPDVDVEDIADPADIDDPADPADIDDPADPADIDDPDFDHLEEDSESDERSEGLELGRAGESESDNVYDPDRLVTYRISLDSYALEQLASNPREYVPALLSFDDGDTSDLLEVGLRLKGAGSFKALPAKSAFRIKIDEYHSGQRLRGLKSLTLNNMIQDPTLMAERLAYYLFRELGVPAPRANHANVFINDEYFGIYANIESPNKDFLKRWFANADRNLYEQSGRDFDKSGGAASFELETNEEDEDPRERLVALEEACTAGDLARARELVDWPRFLMFGALEAAVNQVDGYCYAQSFPNNYRIYDSEDGLVFIPWGLDWALGPIMTQDGGLFVDPFWVRPTHGVLMRMCLADRECTEEFMDAIERVASRWSELDLEGLMDRWAAQTQDALLSDHRREISVETALDDREITRRFIRERPATLFEALESRREE